MKNRRTHSHRTDLLLLLLAVGCLVGCESPKDRAEKHGAGQGETEQQKEERRATREHGKGEGYVDTVYYTKHYAKTKKCQTRMGTLHKELRMYAAVEGRFPDSLDQLIAAGNVSQALLSCPDRLNQPYLYIPGLGPDSDARDVLIYEEKPVHDGHVHVLLVDGTVLRLKPEKAQPMIEASKTKLGRP